MDKMKRRAKTHQLGKDGGNSIEYDWVASE
jgi:hypothetical protein